MGKAEGRRMKAKVETGAKLLPCLFCGGKAVVTSIAKDPPDIETPYWSIQCSNDSRRRHQLGRGCPGMPMCFGDTREQAAARWNTRAPVDGAAQAAPLRVGIEVAVERLTDPVGCVRVSLLPFREGKAEGHAAALADALFDRMESLSDEALQLGAEMGVAVPQPDGTLAGLAPDVCAFNCAACRRKVCTGARAFRPEVLGDSRQPDALYAFAGGQVAAAQGEDEGSCPFAPGSEDELRAAWLRGMAEYRRADGRAGV